MGWEAWAKRASQSNMRGTLKEAVLSITPDYSIARPPTFWCSPMSRLFGSGRKVMIVAPRSLPGNLNS
jgi:hypothetical protein